MAVELTTVSADSATFHDGLSAETVSGLAAATEYEHRGIRFTTLTRPSGTLRCRFATVNDVHFGETEAGRISGSELGPVHRAPPGAAPYPETMNRAAVAEITASGPFVAVFAKGDLTNDGEPAEFAAFESCYLGAFGERLHSVRGNHDCYRGQTEYAGDRWVELPGLNVALVDTCIPERPGGDLGAEQIEWLDALAASSTEPLVVMGHHPQWLEGAEDPPTFVLSAEASGALDDLFARRAAVVAYTAGHTHRHRVRRAGGGVLSIEVGCVKDFPGTWAEYEVYDGGLLQIVHRISAPEALAWSEQCRDLYSDFGVDYSVYGLGTLADRCFAISLRS